VGQTCRLMHEKMVRQTFSLMVVVMAGQTWVRMVEQTWVSMVEQTRVSMVGRTTSMGKYASSVSLPRRYGLTP